MYAREITITNPMGLHARPATLLVQKAGKYESNLQLIKENVIVNPKSIFTVLSAGLGAGTTITIQAEGPDEKHAVDDLCEFIASLKE
ncbi:HPr family phosphocarrier protein [Clostridium sp. C105KSO13]|uniref:HPr family phosphocarrier protein n=1 Tax=Clostridium sp. C105KSO13 TaxID=1776045 RepID=UPI0007406E11|nr:HPr family phosphocarrier protein [Clostridium sp. C105KSO13]CUX38376.1 Phosphocarrier protein HPr [Clostridium sp. C105KSO13]